MILTAGELLVEFVSHTPDCGLKRVTEFSGPYPSGAPAIFIDQAARMGASTRIYGSVGKDAFGEALVARLADDGVDVSTISVLPDLPTGTAHVSYFSDGSRVFVFHINGTAADQVRLSSLPTAPYTLHVSGASLGMAATRAVALELAQNARGVGGRVCCDPNVRAELMGDPQAREALIEIIALSEILMPSEADLAFLYPDQDLDAACDDLLSKGAKIVVLKMGREGVRLVTAQARTSYAPHSVIELDPTGAGDCFCGTFIGLLDIGYDAETACRYANAAGALHVTTRGPMDLNPTLAEIETFLESER